jgi:hypothetical protein
VDFPWGGIPNATPENKDLLRVFMGKDLKQNMGQFLLL